MIRLASILLLLATSAFAAGPFIGEEHRFGPLAQPSSIAIAASSKATLIAWPEGGRIRARLNGVTTDLGPGTTVDVATDGNDFLVVWQDQRRVAGAYMSKPSATIEFSRTNTDVMRPPQVVWDGTRFVVFDVLDPADIAAAADGVTLASTFSSEPTHIECWYGLSRTCYTVPAGYRVSWNFRIGGRTFIVLPSASNHVGFTSSFAPGVAAGKNDFLMAWKTPTAIDGVRIRRDGSVAGFIAVPLPLALSGTRGPSIAWDGTRYLIVFDTVGATSDIWGAVIVPGEKYIVDAFPIAAGDAQEAAPNVATLGSDRFVVGYTVDRNQIATRIVSFTEPLPSRRRPAR